MEQQTNHAGGNLLYPGKVTVCLGAQAGSEGKGNISAWIVKHNKPDHLLSACSRNASHTVIDSRRHAEPSEESPRSKFVFKVLPTGAFYYGTPCDTGEVYTPHFWIGPGAAFTEADLIKEMLAFNIQRQHVHIHPCAGIVSQMDQDYENGIVDFSGAALSAVDHNSGTSAFGTTGSGSGACRARKALRKATIARDLASLSDMVDPNFSKNLHFAIRSGSTALYDGSQGYMLSNASNFYPHVTSRSTLLSSFLSEMDLSPDVLGHVVAVARTMPIRINSNRYFANGKFITWDEVKNSGLPYEVIDSPSGAWYPDQKELSWDEVSNNAGYVVEPELTTLTKLPRRISTFSMIGLEDFLGQNRPSDPFSIHLFFTFTNYLGKSLPAFMNSVKDVLVNHNLIGRVVGSVWGSWSAEAEDVFSLSSSYEKTRHAEDMPQYAKDAAHAWWRTSAPATQHPASTIIQRGPIPDA